MQVAADVFGCEVMLADVPDLAAVGLELTRSPAGAAESLHAYIPSVQVAADVFGCEVHPIYACMPIQGSP